MSRIVMKNAVFAVVQKVKIYGNVRNYSCVNDVKTIQNVVIVS